MRNSPIRRVAVIYAWSPWLVRCIEGVRRYAAQQEHWRVMSGPPSVGGSFVATELRGWKGDGLITLIDDELEVRRARRIGFPVVNLGSWRSKSTGVPRVMVNHFEGGRLAADHLLSRGLRHLAVFGWREAWYTNQRILGFTRKAAEAGITCEGFFRDPRAEVGKSWLQRIVALAKWLATLPRPCGIFAVHDYRARALMEACQEANLKIPDDIALIGMDDDHYICESCSPTLSSIARNSERVGWEAAALLDRMMQGEPPPTGDLFVDPEGVIKRQSTDMLYCGDPLVKFALDYIQDNLSALFNITQIAERAGVSKRTLEMRFRESLGSSPHENLTRIRVEHAKALMANPPKRKIFQIAAECGFGTTQTFYAAFHRVTGETVQSFRKRIAGLEP